MAIFIVLLAFALGVVVGAFSHKYLAAQTKALTGLDAQNLANEAKDAVSKVTSSNAKKK